MVIHEIDGNSTWIELMKNKAQGEIIKARLNALKRMKIHGIVPLHQILDKEISEAYKEEILATMSPECGAYPCSPTSVTTTRTHSYSTDQLEQNPSTKRTPFPKALEYFSTCKQTVTIAQFRTKP